MLVEIDAWYLPDTAATSYRREHLKTTVAPEMIDRDGRAHALLPQRRVLRAGRRGLPRCLPPCCHISPSDVMDPFIELVRFDAGPRPTGERRCARRARPARASISPGVRRQPVSGLGRAPARGSSPAARRRRSRTTTPTRSSPCGWSGRPSSCSPTTSNGCSVPTAPRRAAALRADRRGHEDDLLPPGSPARVRSRAGPGRAGRGVGAGHGRSSAASSADAWSSIGRMGGRRHARPARAPGPGDVDDAGWRPARVPGTAAAAVGSRAGATSMPRTGGFAAGSPFDAGWAGR